MQSVKDNYLIVSIDVEEDMPNWEIESTTTVRNLEGIPKLQELFDRYRIRPTYLLNYPYASDTGAINYFTSIKDRCEIGAHMHPWNTPPLSSREAETIEYPSNLPYEKQYEKMKTVTEKLTNAFGKRPTSYRAGKFGFNDDTKKILGRLGYLVDSSITPMVSWKKQNGPCFLNYRARPFWLNHSATTILEVPVSIGLNRNVHELLEKFFLSIPKFTKIRGLLSKDYLNLLDLIWLYPTLFSEQEMISLAETLLKKSINVLNVFFHSSEIRLGESIYTKSEEDLKKFFKRLDLFFDYAVNEKKMKSVTLSEYRDVYEE